MTQRSPRLRHLVAPCRRVAVIESICSDNFGTARDNDAMTTSLETRDDPGPAITGLVLAGGLGRRMGGVDKGLLPLAGRPMIEHVLVALEPQVSSVWINANRNVERYGAYGHPVIKDTLDGYLGPLAGALSALQQLKTPYLLTVPCDAPLLATDLAARLHSACVANQADVAVATDGSRLHPVFLLLRAGVAPSLATYLAEGGRKVDTWFSRVRLAEVSFEDEPDTFVNVNEPAERDRVEALLLSSRRSGA